MTGLFSPYPNSVSAGVSSSPSTPATPSSTTHVSGDDAIIFTQNIPSALWVITHSFPRTPSIAVYDSTGRQVFPDITVVNSVTIHVAFSGASGGTAILT